MVAVVDPELASGLARASTVAIAGVGTGLIAFLALRGQDRALSLIPSWLLLIVWLFGATMVVLGKLSGDIVISGLVAGLVLILVLIGFTVTQFAFRSAGGPLQLGPPNLVQIKSLAVDGSGTHIFQWSAGKDQITVGEDIERELGLDPGALNVSVDGFLQHMHGSDRERFRLMLWSLQEKQGGDLVLDFRLRRHDGTYLWYDLRAHADPSENTRLLRCVGLMRDVTSLKRSHERLMHDAVHDSLTGLPNRELFMDRVSGAITRAREGQGNRPTVMFIDIDRFKNVNKSFGLVIGDSMLLTLGRRLSRHLNPQDTLARSRRRPIRHSADLRDRPAPGRDACRACAPRAAHADEDQRQGDHAHRLDRHRRRTTGRRPTAQDLLREGEIAMLSAKRGGADRIEIFNPSHARRGREQAAARKRSPQGARAAGRSPCCISRSRGLPRTSSPASRRSSAGTIRPAAGSAPTTSCRSPRRPG